MLCSNIWVSLNFRYFVIRLFPWAAALIYYLHQRVAGVEKVLCKCGGKGQKGSVWRLGGWILQTGTACFCAFCLQQVVVRSRLNSIGRTVVQLAHLPRANSSLLRRGARPYTEPLLFSTSVITFNLLDSCTIRFEFLLCNVLIKVSKKSSTQNHYRRSRCLPMTHAVPIMI